MGFWKNIVKYFIPDTSSNEKFDLESFFIGVSGETFYPETTNFVLLQQTNFVLNNVIGKIAKKLSNATFTDDSETALLKKINNPNKFQSKEEFLKEFTSYVLAAGFTIIWKRYVSFANFETLELINVNPSTAKIEKDTVFFQFENEEIKTQLSDVILFYDNVRNDVSKKGKSRIIPLRTQIENIELAQKAKNIQISNSGTTIVSPKQVAAGSNIDDGLNAPVPQMGGGLISQKDEMENKLNNRGLNNRIIVSSKGLDAVNLSEKLSAIDFHKIIETDLLAVCDAYSVPIELTPYGTNATYENKGVAELSLMENEVLPLVHNLIRSLNSEFQNKGKLKVNYDSIEVMSIIKARTQDTNQKTIDQYSVLFDKGIITDKEFKQILIDNNILDGSEK